MAWELFADPVGARFASAYLHHHRGIDVRPSRHGQRVAQSPDAPDRGGPAWWTSWADAASARRAACRGPGPVHPSRHLIDTLRDRVVSRSGPRRTHRRLHRPRRQWRPAGTEVPKPRPHASVRQVAHPLPAHLGHSSGGDGGRRRRTTGRPRHRRHRSHAGLADRVIPVSANGTAVSGPQAGVRPRPAGIVLALDGDDAGRAGTERWLDALTLQRHRLPGCRPARPGRPR